jgi:carbamoyltransferase
MHLLANVSKKVSEEQLFGINKLKVKRSQIPSVTHVDYTARVQTVHKETNPCYYDLICHFEALSCSTSKLH